MSKISYVNANLISTYDTFANWLVRTNQITFDMGTSVVTTNSSAIPDVTNGNGYINGFFGSNTMYVFTALHGGTPTAFANLNITSNVYINSNTTVAANLVVIGTANVTVNLNSVGIVSNNITANNNLTVTNTATLNTATAVIANIATANITTLGVTGTGTALNLNVTNIANLNSANIVSANITTLGVTGLATLVNTSIGTGTSNVQANTTQVTISNPSAVATVNATTFSGTAANATNLNGQPGSFYTTATNITTGTLPWGQHNPNTVNTTGAFTITGVRTHNANLFINTANHLLIGNNTVNTTANQTTLTISNSTSTVAVNASIIYVGNTLANVTVNSTVFSGTANNSLALAGYIANNAVPSDGFVLAWNQAESRIKWTNPSGISTALNSNAIVANASLQAGSNGTVFVLTAEGNTTSTNLVMRANNISLTVDSGAVLFNSNAFVNAAVLSVGNTTANVTVNTTVITVGNSSVNATINSTAFSRQANGATNLGPEGSGINLLTLQSQITSNASAAYTNAVANSANASNITTGTIGAGFLPATVVNTSGAFTITGVHTMNANLNMNTANQILIGNVTVNAVANQTSLAIFNGSSNLVANASTINFVAGAATINSTSYSRQANGATNLGPEGSGVTLATLESRITSNASVAFTNATSFVTGNNWTSTANLTFTGTNTVFTNLISANGGIFRLTATGPAYWLQQDGTGRTHWYWNSAGGASPTFAAASEDASALTISSTATGAGGSFFHRSADGTGKAAGAALTWTTTLYVDLNNITWKGSAVAVANGATYNLTANNASFLGTIAASSYQLNSTLSANVATMTAFDSNRLGTIAAASYQLNSTLSANVATMTALNAINIGGTDTQSVIASLRSNRNLTGGGTITVDASTGNIKWNSRFIVISNGYGSNFSTNGYFDIVCPDGVTAGQTSVTGVGGATNKTVTTAGIPLAAWEALYYILPIGSVNTVNYANFRVASYTSALDIPSTWVLICFRNGDNGAIYFNNGVTLYQGQSYNTNTQSSVTINATSLGGVAAASYALTSSLSSYAALSGASFTGNLTCGAGLFEKAVDLGAGTAFNMNLGTYFFRTISGATTFTVSNVPASGTVASFTVELINGGSAAITWMAGTRWAGGAAPTLTASGRDILVFTTRDGGSIWYGSAAILNAV